MSTTKAVVRRTAIYSAVLLFYVAVLYAFGITCPIYALTGFKCPTCGVTRAMMSLFRLDFHSYASYNPLAAPILLAVWYLINADLFKHKRVWTTVSIMILVAKFIMYVINLII